MSESDYNEQCQKAHDELRRWLLVNGNINVSVVAMCSLLGEICSQQEEEVRKTTLDEIDKIIKTSCSFYQEFKDE